MMKFEITTIKTGIGGDDALPTSLTLNEQLNAFQKCDDILHNSWLKYYLSASNFDSHPGRIIENNAHGSRNQITLQPRHWTWSHKILIAKVLEILYSLSHALLWFIHAALHCVWLRYLYTKSAKMPKYN